MDGLLSSLSSRQLAEWMAFYSLEPFGYKANALGHGIVAAAVYNSKRQKGGKVVKASDFIPDADRDDNRVTEPTDVFTAIKRSLGFKSKGQDR